MGVLGGQGRRVAYIRCCCRRVEASSGGSTLRVVVLPAVQVEVPPVQRRLLGSCYLLIVEEHPAAILPAGQVQGPGGGTPVGHALG